MNRCRICDVVYDPRLSERFVDEGYCPVCEGEISQCLEELEDFEEVEGEADFD